MYFPTKDIVVASAIMGLIFGFVLQKGSVYAPQVIMNQFNFTDFPMLKMFLSAVASSMVVFTLFDSIKILRPMALKVRVEELNNSRGVPATVLGASLLGLGMAVCGACPGTVLAQIGSGVQNSLYVLAGSLVGALVFGYLAPSLAGFISAGLPVSIRLNPGIDQYFNLPYRVVCLGMAAMCASIVYFLEVYVVEYHEDLDACRHDIERPYLGRVYWAPYFAGMVVGVLQAPAIIYAKDTLGSAQSQVTLLANILPESLRNSYFNNFRTGMSNYWQLIYMGCVIMGSFLAAQTSSNFATITSPRAPVISFLGGFLILFGARLAGGCTSGHGISGMAMGSIRSVFAVVSMFGAAIIATLIFDAVL